MSMRGVHLSTHRCCGVGWFFCLRGGILLDSVAARNEIFEKDSYSWWYFPPWAISCARYNCSTRISRTSWWGNTSGLSDHTRLARERNASVTPYAPPITKVGVRLLVNAWLRDRDRAGELSNFPRSSRTTMNSSAPQRDNIRSDSSRRALLLSNGLCGNNSHTIFHGRCKRF